MARQFVGQHYGKNVYFENYSYSCPFYGLYDYRTETGLKRAIRKKALGKRG